MKSFLKSIAALGVGVFLGVSSQAAEVRLQGAGSTFVAPMMQSWVTEYQSLHPEALIDYQSIGSGGGIKMFTEKTIGFGCSDAPMNKKELDKAGGNVVQIPIIAGAIVLGYNLGDFNGDIKLDGPIVADMYLGKIKQWNDARIVALNPGVQIPNLPVTAVHRTDGSGTTYIFSNYISTQSTEFKEKVGAAKQVEWPGGAGGKGNEGVTDVVHTTKGGIGYIELAYANQNKIPFATIKNKDGEFIKATSQGTSAAGEAAAKTMETSLVASLWNQAGKDVYPISGFTYVLIYQDMGYLKDEAKAKTLVDFLNWAATDGQKMASKLDYAPLSAAVQKKVVEAIGTLQLGGKPVKTASAK